ncbi:DUF5683 domain-containing protein [Cellulophaga baltica]|uniref:DUF5683 domain-containing protein n=1 Tax=Cellulophaga baltica TaxID=76594 RepID=UPI0037C7316A
MVNKFLFFLLFFVGFTFATQAQDEKPTPKEDTQLDSIQTDLKSQGIVVKDSVFKKRVEINPLAPAKAAFYSAIIPGLGQVYNKRYWKVPIVYAALGASIYAYDFNNTSYKRFRTAFKRRQAGFTDDEFPEFDIEDLQNAQENFQRDRDLMVLVTIGLYVLNIIDANVDSHLKQFNVDDNLSVDFQPYLDYNEITAQPNYGMALTIKF